MNYVKVYLLFVLTVLVKPLPSLLLVIYSLKQPSALSLTLLVISLFTIFKFDKWGNSYKLVGILTVLAMMCIYIIQFLIATTNLLTHAPFIMWLFGIPNE